MDISCGKQKKKLWKLQNLTYWGTYRPNSTSAAASSGASFFSWFRINVASLVHDFSSTWANGSYSKRISQTETADLFSSHRPRVGTDTRGSHIAAGILCLHQKMSQLIFTFFEIWIAYNFHQSGLIMYLLQFFFFCRPSSAVRRPPSEMVRSATQHCLCWPRMLTGLLKKVTNLIVFMVNTNFDCRNCMLVRNIRC